MSILPGGAEKNSILEFARSTAAGLSASPKRLDCRFLYDREGSLLFERITRQPEYYLSRIETELLAVHAKQIRKATGAVALAELGSGSSAKTFILLRAWIAAGKQVRYVPIDVSRSALAGACRRICSTFGSVRVIGVNTDYQTSFPLLKELSPVLVLFLGSSIGNFGPNEMSLFFGTLSDSLAPGDFLLLGVDLAKDKGVIEAAYNDAAGVTAAFTRNIFARMNRELGSRIDLDAIDHLARYCEEREQVEIKASFKKKETIRVAPLGATFMVEEGEKVQVEISRKFRLQQFIPYLSAHGFRCEEVFTDARDWYALLLLRRRATSPYPEIP